MSAATRTPSRAVFGRLRAAIAPHIAELAAQGVNDSLIGNTLGLTHDQVWTLRKLHAIPAGAPIGRPRTRTATAGGDR